MPALRNQMQKDQMPKVQKDRKRKVPKVPKVKENPTTLNQIVTTTTVSETAHIKIDEGTTTEMSSAPIVTNVTTEMSTATILTMNASESVSQTETHTRWKFLHVEIRSFKIKRSYNFSTQTANATRNRMQVRHQ